jgi:hypothetical protein
MRPRSTVPVPRLALLTAALAAVGVFNCVDAAVETTSGDEDVGTARQEIHIAAPHRKLLWTNDNATGGEAVVWALGTSGDAITQRLWRFAQWQARGISGQRLLWQRTTDGLVSFWTITDGGEYLSHVYWTPTLSGLQARGVTRVSPLGGDPQDYLVLFERQQADGVHAYVSRVSASGSFGAPRDLGAVRAGHRPVSFARAVDGTYRLLLANASTPGRATLERFRASPTGGFTRDGRVAGFDLPARGLVGYAATSFTVQFPIVLTSAPAYAVLFSRQDGEAIVLLLDAQHNEVSTEPKSAGGPWKAVSIDGGQFTPCSTVNDGHGSVAAVGAGGSGDPWNDQQHLFCVESVDRGECTHRVTEEGPRLWVGCHSCVERVCAADPYCCNVRWDWLCRGAGLGCVI